jgi:two-component system response regulator YesN
VKLIILEDELIQRQGILNKLLNSSLPIEVAGEAGNGIAGLELVKTVEPDIVITDIRMPGMDGLTFIQHAFAINPKLHFIIVSIYNDFNYAKQAIQLGVVDYLLKPVDNEELIECLSRVIKKIELERKKTEEVAKLWKEQKVNHETIHQHMLTKFVQQGGKSGFNIVSRDEQIVSLKDRTSHYLSVVFILEALVMPHGSFQIGDYNLLWFAIKNIISDRLESSGHEGILFRHTVHESELVYVLGVDSSDDKLRINQVLEVVLDDIRHCLKLEITIAIGSIVKEIEQLQQSYQQAKLVIRNKIIHGANRLYDVENVPKSADHRRSILSEVDGRMIFQRLKDSNKEALIGWIENRIAAIARDPDAVYIQLEWFCVDVYLVYRKYLLMETTMSKWLIGEMDDLLQELQGLSRWEEAINLMVRYIVNIVEYSTQYKSAIDQDVMGEVKRYIDNCFYEPLTLQTISERFYINSNYFSRRFKERFGENFVDYITSLRMNKAAQMLLEPDVKIYQIAEMVGYEDGAYFSSVFRKFFGETPKQYRENRINQ